MQAIFFFFFSSFYLAVSKKKFFLSRGQTKKRKSSALRGLVRTGGWEGRGWIATCCSRRGNLRKRRGARSEALTGARRRARRTHTGAFDRREVCCAGLAQEPRGTTENKFNPLPIWLIRHWRSREIPTSVGQNSRPVVHQPPACKESKLQHALIQLLLEENKKKITNYSQ